MRFWLRSSAVSLVFFAASAVAQSLNCTIPLPNVVITRVQGISEPLGDVLIQCNASGQAVAGQSYLIGDIKIYINTNLVNRIVGPGLLSDIVLVTNENNCNGNNCAPTTVSTLGGPQKNVPVPQFGQLFLVNAVQWSAVKIPIPDAKAPDGSTFPPVTTFRITNLRANALLLALSSTIITPVIVLFGATVADATAVPGATKQLVLGTLQPGLIVSGTVAQLPQCQSQNIVNGAVSGPPTFTVSFREGFEYAFRPLGKPTTDGGIRAGEDGYPTPGYGANGGGADQGTRLRIALNNLSPGVRIAVPATVTNGTLSLQLVNTDQFGNGPYQPAAASGLVELQISAGSAMAVYEVVGSNPTTIESADIPVVVGYTANLASNLPSTGQATFNASFAPAGGPLASIFTSDPSAPLPRFADISGARNAFAITVCMSSPPAILGVTPSSLPAGTGQDAVLVLAGSGFTQASVVEWNGSAIPTSLSGVGTLMAHVSPGLTARPGTAQLDVLNPDGLRSNPVTFTITGAPPPAINAGGAVNAANSKALLARGSLASIYGMALASSTGTASGFPLPVQLGGATVTVNGRAAPLIYASPAQINFQVPFETPITGTAAIAVMRDSVGSAQVSVSLAEFAPGIFNAAGQPIVLHADYSLVTPAKPASKSEILIIYGTGLGGLNYLPATGAATSGTPPVARVMPTITVGGQAGDMLYAGLASGFAGLAQFNVRMPASLPAGATQPLVLAFGSVSDTVTIAVANSAPSQLTVELTDVLPRKPVNDDNLRLEYTVRNPNNFTGNLIHMVYLSKNPSPTTADQTLATSGDVMLGTGDHAYFYSGISLPAGTVPGRYYVASGVVASGDKDPSHIALSSPIPIDVVPQRAPFDLGVTLKGISPTTVAAGNPIVVSYSVQEPSGISGTFTRSVYIAPQNSISTKDTLINIRTFDLVRGSLSLDSVNNIIPATLKPGNYWIGVIVQTDGDTNTANNTSVALPIIVAAPGQSIAFAATDPTRRAEEAPAGPQLVESQDKPEQ